MTLHLEMLVSYVLSYDNFFHQYVLSYLSQNKIARSFNLSRDMNDFN